MSVDYVSAHPVNLQDAVRDLDARLKALEPKTESKPSVAERVDKMLDEAHSHGPLDPTAAVPVRPAPEPAKTTAPVVAPAAPKV